jgi:hypothetical protein
MTDPVARDRPPEGTRLVLVGIEFLSQFGTRTDSGDFITAEWGEPDEHGWYTPTFTTHADDNPVRDAEDRAADVLYGPAAGLREALEDAIRRVPGLGAGKIALLDSAIDHVFRSGRDTGRAP